MPTTKKLRDEAKYRLLLPLDAETYAGLRSNDLRRAGYHDYMSE
jgi:hypothetical protein